MSAISLRIKITGLCLFVPRDEIEDLEEEETTQMRLLLVESSRPLLQAHSSSHATLFHEPHEPHVPVLVCPYEAVCRNGSYRSEDASYVDVAGYQWAVFYLEDQDAWLDGAEPGKLQVLTSDKGGGSGCATEENLDSFLWVPSMVNVSPGSERIRPTCLDDHSVDSSVIGRVALTEGIISTFYLAQDGDRRVANWEFKTLADESHRARFRQSLADIVLVETEVQSDFVTIVTKLLRYTKNPRVRAIFGRHVGTTRSIQLDSPREVWIKNMPWIDILGTRPPIRRGPRDPETHFAHFYNLSPTTASLNIPHQVGQCDTTDPRHRGNPNCPPTRAAADPRA